MTDAEAKQIIELCIELLTPESKWNKNSLFEEKCLINAKSFTLGCALELMQISVLGKAESRNKLMGRVRWKIFVHFIGRYFIHPITNFNKHKKTTYKDLMFILNEVKKSFE